MVETEELLPRRNAVLAFTYLARSTNAHRTLLGSQA